MQAFTARLWRFFFCLRTGHQRGGGQTVLWYWAGKANCWRKWQTQGRCLSKSGLFSNAVDAETLPQDNLSPVTVVHWRKPARRRSLPGSLKAAQKGALAHADATRQRIHAVRNAQVVVQEVEQLSQTLALPQLCHRATQLLRLGAIRCGEGSPDGRATLLAVSIP